LAEEGTIVCFGVWHEHAAEETRKRNIMEANILNNLKVFVKKRNNKLQKVYFHNFKHWACRERQFKIDAGN
jgi:hypothetical protein